MDINKLVTSYITLRDKKAQIKAKYDNEVAKVEEVMKRVEGALLQHFETNNVEAVSTAAGTAYTATRSSATVADRDVFREFILGTDNWQLADIRASKKAIEEYRNVHQELPPGINFSTERVVNIRRG